MVFISPLALAQSVRLDGPLLDSPDGARIASLKTGAPAQVIKRQGFWVQVKSGGKTGWLRLNQLQFGGVSGVVALDTGRATADNIVSTSVARGLNAQNLLQGRPDLVAVARLDAFVPGAASIDRFSAEGGVKPMTTAVTLKPPAVAKAKAGTDSHDN